MVIMMILVLRVIQLMVRIKACFCVCFIVPYDTLAVVEPGTSPDDSEPPSSHTHTNSPSDYYTDPTNGHTESPSDSSNNATIIIEGNLSSNSKDDSKITAALSVAVVSLVVAAVSLLVASGSILFHCVSSRKKYAGYNE